jgi:hypothetical protein
VGVAMRRNTHSGHQRHLAAWVREVGQYRPRHLMLRQPVLRLIGRRRTVGLWGCHPRRLCHGRDGPLGNSRRGRRVVAAGRVLLLWRVRGETRLLRRRYRRVVALWRRRPRLGVIDVVGRCTERRGVLRLRLRGALGVHEGALRLLPLRGEAGRPRQGARGVHSSAATLGRWVGVLDLVGVVGWRGKPLVPRGRRLRAPRRAVGLLLLVDTSASVARRQRLRRLVVGAVRVRAVASGGWPRSMLLGIAVAAHGAGTLRA